MMLANMNDTAQKRSVEKKNGARIQTMTQS